MPNPSMRQSRPVQTPNPVFTTDSDGNRVGDRPQVGPASAQQVHAALQAQDALAKAPRPTPPQAQATVGDTNADNPTKDLTVTTAANRLANRQHQVASAIDSQSQ